MPVRGSPHVLRDPPPFVERRAEQVEVGQVLDDAITRPVIIALRLERPEHAVPDDEHAGIILVEIARVGRMVDAVMRRRVHHRLKPARHAPDHLGMDPELIDEVQPRDEEDHRGRKSDHEQRQTEDEAQAEEAGPGLPQCGRQIIMLAAVVDDMARPEPAYAVGRAVEDIISEIVEHKGEDEPVPGIADVEEAELVDPDRYGEDEATRQHARNRAAKAEHE